MLPNPKSRWSSMVKNVELQDISDADRFRQLLNDISKSEDQYILKDNGQPLAALLSLSDLEVLKQAKQNKQKAWDLLFENLEKIHARNPDVSEEQVHADVEEAIRAVRQQHA